MNENFGNNFLMSAKMDWNELKPFQNLYIDIGSGGGGTVKLFYDPKREVLRVVKELKKAQSEDRGDFTPERFDNEKNVLNGINHPAILKLFRSLYNRNNSNNSPWLEYEFIPFGSVYDLLADRSLLLPKLDVTQQYIIIYGIARGMRYMHSRNVIHRDLKPQNIMINGIFEPIIIDFGLAKVIRGESRNDTKCGTINYLPPEILNDNNQRTQFTFKSDVFSFALTINAIITETQPFYYIIPETNYTKSHHTKIIKEKIIGGERPGMKENCFLNDLINKCWVDDSEKRPDFEEICLDIEKIFNEKYLPSVFSINNRTKYRNRFLEYKEKLDFAEKTPNTYVRMEYGTLANFEYAASLGLPRAMKDYSYFLSQYGKLIKDNYLENKSDFYIIAAAALSKDIESKNRYIDYMCTLNNSLKVHIYPEIEEPSISNYQSSSGSDDDDYI